MQVYDRLQKLHLSVSHKTAIRLLDKFSDVFDRDVLKWKDELEMRVLSTTNNHVGYIKYILYDCLMVIVIMELMAVVA